MTEVPKIPAHVAIIMDGNGRWALRRGMERTLGHAAAVESVRAAIESSLRRGVRYLTLYAFSAENWGRPQKEVDALMELLCRSIIGETPDLVQQGVAVKVIGSREKLSADVLQHMARMERDTVGGAKLTLLLAINYGSRSELVDAVKSLAAKAAAGQIDPDGIDPQALECELYTAGCPDPDLLIRTGGEQRLSNFLLWQLAYAELYFTQTLWPDFRQADFDNAIEAYSARERRFGLIEKEID